MPARFKTINGKRYFYSGRYSGIPSIKKLKGYHSFVYEDLYRKAFKVPVSEARGYSNVYDIYVRTERNEKKYRAHLKKRKTSGLFGSGLKI